MDISTFSQLVENDIFIYGVAFTIIVQFFTIVIDVPCAIARRQHQREAEMLCQLRREGAVTELCKYRHCPASRFCRFYDRTPWYKRVLGFRYFLFGKSPDAE